MSDHFVFAKYFFAEVSHGPQIVPFIEVTVIGCIKSLYVDTNIF